MRALLHILVIDADRGAALAGWHGPRWILPLACCHERARAGLVVTRWLEEQQLQGDVVGQWLGCLAPAANAIDWLVVVNATSPAAAPFGLSWTPLRWLAAAPSSIDYQHRVLARSLAGADLPCVPGPFGSMTWPGEVRTWLAAHGARPIGRFVPYRITSHAVVLGVPTAAGIAYFKGLTRERSHEARITAGLAALDPERFARTLALEPRGTDGVWWLTDACPGIPLSRCFSIDGARRTAAACAEAQIAATRAGLDLPGLDIPAALTWCTRLIAERQTPRSEAVSTALVRACDDVTSAKVPQSWVPFDLDPENVLLDSDGGFSFIDLDDSCLGPAPLAAAAFTGRIRRLRTNRWGAIPVAASYRAYEEAWRPVDLSSCSWRSYELAAAVVNAHLGWGRVVEGSGRSEVTGVLDVACQRLAERLVRAVEVI